MNANDNPGVVHSSPGAPFLSGVLTIDPAWIDYNGHLNMAYYNVLFDRATDELWDAVGIGPAYRNAQNCSIFSAECHLRYIREVHLGEPLRVSIFLIAADEKRLHTFKQLHHATEGWLSATSENMSLHVTMNGPKVTAFPSEIYASIKRLEDSHRTIPSPDGVGRSIGMRSK